MKDTEKIEEIAMRKMEYFENTSLKLVTGKQADIIEQRVVDQTNKEYYKPVYITFNISFALTTIFIFSSLVAVYTNVPNVNYLPLGWIDVGVCCFLLIILLILYRFINSFLKNITRDRIGHLLRATLHERKKKRECRDCDCM